jgi:hypothetical protein
MNTSLIANDQPERGSLLERPSQIQHAPPLGAANPNLAAQIALKRNIVIVVAVVWMVTAFAPVPGALAGIEILLFAVAHIAGVVFCFQLARLLGKKEWYCAGLALIPFANLLGFAQIAADATKALKSYKGA